MNRPTRILPLLALSMLSTVFLSACELVEFQSPPSLPLAECDADLVGDWRVRDLSDSASKEGEQYLRVTAKCEHWYSIDIETDESGQVKPDIDDIEDDFKLGITHAGHQSYIAALKQPDPQADGAAASRPSGYVLVAYEFIHHDVLLRQVDLKATAHLIVDGVIPGWIEKHDRNMDGSRRSYGQDFSVFVFGSSSETEELLKQHELLSKPWMLLSPVDTATRKRLNKWMAQPRTSKSVK